MKWIRNRKTSTCDFSFSNILDFKYFPPQNLCTNRRHTLHKYIYWVYYIVLINSVIVVGVFSNAVFQLKTKRYVKRWAIFQTLFTSDPCERRRVFEAILVRFGLVRISVRSASWFGAFNCDVTEKLSHVTVSFSERIALPNHSLPPHSTCRAICIVCIFLYDFALFIFGCLCWLCFECSINGAQGWWKSWWEKVVKSGWKKVVKASGWQLGGKYGAAKALWGLQRLNLFFFVFWPFLCWFLCFGFGSDCDFDSASVSVLFFPCL